MTTACRWCHGVERAELCDQCSATIAGRRAELAKAAQSVFDRLAAEPLPVRIIARFTSSFWWLRMTTRTAKSYEEFHRRRHERRLAAAAQPWRGLR
jgi:hypothetical protein